jgi:glyoxylase-like metal-dependent hydrolase (beta-lactamase superfamily II)
LFVHEAERDPVAGHLRVRATFSRRHTLDEDFEVIPTPGHTPGATAYLWDSGAHRVLFSGDTIFLRDGEWRGALLDSSDRSSYIDSLLLFRELEFDVLVPWAASIGQPYHAVTSQADARRRIDAIIERLRRGESG